MKTVRLDCGNCGSELSIVLSDSRLDTSCPICDAEMHVGAFPALFRETSKGEFGEDILIADESSCFYHPEKKAVVHCEGCGRFLCALCDIEMKDQHLCPTCVETGVEKEELGHIKKEKVYYDNIAVAVAIVPMIVLYLTFISAPIALFISLRYWKTPLSVLPRSRWRFVVAIIFSLLQISGWCMGVLYLVSEF